MACRSFGPAEAGALICAAQEAVEGGFRSQITTLVGQG